MRILLMASYIISGATNLIGLHNECTSLVYRLSVADCLACDRHSELVPL